MAAASVTLHLRDDDVPFVERLQSGTVALWLSAKHEGPVICGSPEELLEIRRAIGRYLFPEEFEQPEAVKAA